VVLAVWECVRSPEAVAALICCRISNAGNNWTYSWQIRGRRYGTKYTCIQAAIFGAPDINQSCLFCCDVSTVHTLTWRNFVRRSARETGISWARVHRLQRTGWKICIPRLLRSLMNIFIKGCRFVNYFRDTYSRMHSLWRRLFGPMKPHLRPTTRRISAIACMGALETDKFVRTQRWIYRDSQPGLEG
jgi:hypothetical protein